MPPRSLLWDSDRERSVQILQYRLRELKKATSNFSDNNKLGSGGSGDVYKGKVNGRTVAIKKLQGSFVKGLVNIANEVSLLSSLEHDNLVKLLGFCSEDEHNILVYEFIPNGDLSSYLKDENKREELTWDTRFNIIYGIARGLSYLHHNLKDPVIHHDLKPENVLLDENYNAKIADFDISKIFNINKTHNTTRNGGGTPGYYAPELYFLQQYSPKSDVYNFGLLVLEIIAGCTIPHYPIRNNGDALQHVVWRQWKNNNPFTHIIDQSIRNDRLQDKIERCMLIALLCIQNDYNKRPDMKSVLQMLNNYDSLSAPDYPGFLQEGSSSRVDDTSNSLEFQPTEDEATHNQLDSRGRIEFQPIEHAIPTDPSTVQAKQYSLLDIMIATNKFSIDLCVGNYKGVLDGQEVVVQKYEIDIRETLFKIISFVLEGRRRDILLPDTRHPIVNILGCCWEDSEKKLYLVFEYPRKGLLCDYLYDIDDRSHREWSTYERIIKGIANAICYLHHSSRQKYLVLHRNLDPSIIWLDESWNVQFSSFRWTTVLDRGETFSEISLPNGRLGYITRDDDITYDVFEFGVTLLSILLGKKSFEVLQDDLAKPVSVIEEEFLNIVWDQWDSAKDMLEYLDARIRNYRSEEARCYFETALLCVQPEPELRPNMVEVVKMLNSHVTLPIRSSKHRRS